MCSRLASAVNRDLFKIGCELRHPPSQLHTLRSTMPGETCEATGMGCSWFRWVSQQQRTGTPSPDTCHDALLRSPSLASLIDASSHASATLVLPSYVVMLIVRVVLLARQRGMPVRKAYRLWPSNTRGECCYCFRVFTLPLPFIALSPCACTLIVTLRVFPWPATNVVAACIGNPTVLGEARTAAENLEVGKRFGKVHGSGGL